MNFNFKALFSYDFYFICKISWKLKLYFHICAPKKDSN